MKPIKKSEFDITSHITLQIIKNDWNEYEVQVFKGKQKLDRLTYYTEDKNDAIDTYDAMITEIKTRGIGG